MLERGWGHAQTEQGFPRCAGPCAADGPGAQERARVPVGGDHLDCREDQMCRRDAPELGPTGRALRGRESETSPAPARASGRLACGARRSSGQPEDVGDADGPEGFRSRRGSEPPEAGPSQYSIRKTKVSGRFHNPKRATATQARARLTARRTSSCLPGSINLPLQMWRISMPGRLDHGLSDRPTRTGGTAYAGSIGRSSRPAAASVTRRCATTGSGRNDCPAGTGATGADIL